MTWFGFGWGTTEVSGSAPPDLDKLRRDGGSQKVEQTYKGQGTLVVRDPKWFGSTIPPETVFKVMVKEGPNIGFGVLPTEKLGATLVLTQPGDPRSAPRYSTFVVNGEQTETVICPSGGGRITSTWDRPRVDRATLNFFLGDGVDPVAVFVPGSEEPFIDYEFNPICDKGRRTGDVNSLVITPRVFPRGHEKAGTIYLTVETRVGPTMKDRCLDCKDLTFGCAVGTARLGLDAASSALGVAQTVASTAVWSLTHPTGVPSAMRSRVVTFLGGTMEQNAKSSEEKKDD